MPALGLRHSRRRIVGNEGLCASKLVKNGRTSSGRTRWRCKRPRRPSPRQISLGNRCSRRF
ncbi:IS1/IS1595 family N-terminal zinc-binding domain-containing protein [Brevibacterium sp. FAM 27836]|uniref:IS1/IS1595 family N-terminal zinc-binding domain-containing protein n=1 Tax=Brevibacterium sp. FAM 27836 TaxID=3446693 RepID=UPI003F515957